MKSNVLFGAVAAVLIVVGGMSNVMAETHQQIQAVDETGHATYYKVGAVPDPVNKVTVEGIVINNPEDILNPAYDAPGWMGGQWQIYVQGQGSDHAGTAVWLGQKYANMGPGHISYDPNTWASELNRVNYPDGHQIRQGDYVRITGYCIEYNGKTNINERHDSDPSMDFTVEWLGQTPGLPQPELISLSDIKDANNVEYFDSSRASGGEYYQGRLVRIRNVSLSGTFAPNATVTLSDGTGRTLPVKLGLSSAFNTSNLGSTFDIVGIFDQEYGYASGYRLWVTGYDGSSDLLGTVSSAYRLLGDANSDGVVNFSDYLPLSQSFGATGAVWGQGDFSGTRSVDFSDYRLQSQGFGSGGAASPVPEPVSAIMLGPGSLMVVRFPRKTVKGGE